MLKKTTIILLFLSIRILNAQCPTTNITLSTQTQVNNFATNYPGCTTLNYDLTISGSSITNLNGLSGITSTEKLDIINCPTLTDVSGLNNLTSVTGTMFRFRNNPLLTSLPSFNSLVTINSLVISNSNFTVINSFGNLTNLNSLGIDNCPNLTAIESFGNLTTDLNNLSLVNLPLLNSITSLSNVQHINRISIINCNSIMSFLNELDDFELAANLNYLYLSGATLLSLQPLANLQSVDIFQLVNCPVITDFNGLQNINFIGNLTTDNCSSLINLNGLQNIVAINGFLEIKNSSSLINLEGLNNINLLGSLEIKNNQSLNSINSLANLSQIDGSLIIKDNQNLLNFQGLNSLTAIGPVLEITNNSSLNSLTALLNLTWMDHINDPGLDNVYFGIINNSNLTSLSGLDNLQLNDANNYFNLNIYNNSLLTFGSVPSICNYLNLNKPHTINSNSTGCQSSSEILTICQNLDTDNFTIEPYKIFPNPTKDKFFLSKSQNNLEINLYDNLGRKMNFTKTTENEFSIENLPAGIYVVEIIFEHNKTFKKVVKE